MIRTTLCYIEQEGKYLMLYRNKKKQDVNAGKWIGVGGKFEEGETPDACMKREIFEETGLSVTQYSFRGLIHFLPDGGPEEEMYLYTVSSFTGTLVTSCPEGELKWIPKDEVLSLPTWEGDPYFLRKILLDEPPFHMALVYDSEGGLKEVRDYSDSASEERGDALCKEPVLTEKANLASPHGFSTRIGGVSSGIYFSLNLGMNRGDKQDDVKENWRRFFVSCGITPDLPFVCGKQVHGNEVHIVTYKDARPAYGEGFMHEADGYVTKEKNLPLAIFTADCVPVLMEDTAAGVVGAVHLGWRSTVADIEKSAVDAFIECGSDPTKIHIAIGSSIEACCFEVGEEVVEACENLLGRSIRIIETSGQTVFAKEPIGGKASDESILATPSTNDGKYMLDLKSVIAERFMQLGVPANQIEKVGQCTRCHPERYYSHRYAGSERGSLASVICRV